MLKQPLALPSQCFPLVLSEAVSSRRQGPQKSKKVINRTSRNRDTAQSYTELSFDGTVFKRNDNGAPRQKGFFENCRGHKSDSQSCLDCCNNGFCGIHINGCVELLA